MDLAAEVAALDNRADKPGRFPAQTADADEMGRIVALVDHAAPDVQDQLMILPSFDGCDEQNEALRQLARGDLARGLAPLQEFREGRAILGYGYRRLRDLQRGGIPLDIICRIFGHGENVVGVFQRPPHELLEHDGGVLVARFARIYRDQIMHRHDEPGAELALQREDAMDVVLVHPGCTQQAENRGPATVEHADSGETLGSGQYSVSGVFGRKGDRALRRRQKQVLEQRKQEPCRDLHPVPALRIETQEGQSRLRQYPVAQDR